MQAVHAVYKLINYSSLPIIGTRLLPNSSVVIREVSYCDRERHLFTVSAAKNFYPKFYINRDLFYCIL